MFGREPALIIGAIGALIALGVGFGLPVTSSQVGLILAAVTAVLTLITRSQVVPTDKANSQILTATRMPEGTRVDEVIAKEARDSK